MKYNFLLEFGLFKVSSIFAFEIRYRNNNFYTNHLDQHDDLQMQVTIQEQIKKN